MLGFREFILESHIKDVKIDHSTGSYAEHENHLEIFSVRTPQKHRGKGGAHKVVKHITDIADAAGKKTKLLASPLDKKTNTNKLVSLYRKHGFEVTGERGNMAGDPWMERPPKSKGK